MGRYRIEFKKSAVKEIRALPSKEIKGILKTIDALSEDPRSQDSIKLSGEEKYRARCGDYRILYKIEDGVLIVYIVKVGHRREVYR